MNATLPCQQCDRPSDGWLCHACTRGLVENLRCLVEDRPNRVGCLLGELDIVIARDVKLAAAPSGTAAGLPYGYAASEARYLVRSTLIAWIRAVAAHRGYRVAIRADLPQMARWLVQRADWIRQLAPSEHDGGAGQCAEEIRYMTGEVRRVIDCAPNLWFAGACDHCPHVMLYGVADQHGTPLDGTITCPACETTYHTTERRQNLLHRARSITDTASVISRALSKWTPERPVTPAMIRKYVHNCEIHRYRPNRAGQPRYNLGEVLDAAERAATRRPQHHTCATA